MRQRKGKKILIYFFLLLLVGSINNIELNNLEFKKIKDINVEGLDNDNNLILLQKIKNLELSNIFFINKTKISNHIRSNSLVEKFEIFRKYPSSLDIKINQTRFLARINKNGKTFFVGSNGRLTEANFSNNNLPFIFGKPRIEEFLNFKNIIDESKFVYSKIKNLYFFSSNRWDLELSNDVLIKLPKNYTKESLELAYEFLQNQNFQDIKIIDARVNNQIILND